MFLYCSITAFFCVKYFLVYHSNFFVIYFTTYLFIIFLAVDLGITFSNNPLWVNTNLISIIYKFLFYIASSPSLCYYYYTNYIFIHYMPINSFQITALCRCLLNQIGEEKNYKQNTFIMSFIFTFTCFIFIYVVTLPTFFLWIQVTV